MSKSQGVQLPNEEFIKDIEEGEGFKYSGLLEVVRFKEKVRKEYFCCTKKILKQNLTLVMLWQRLVQGPWLWYGKVENSLYEWKTT